MYNLLIVSVQPSRIVDTVKFQFSKNTGISISDISDVIIEVDGHLMGILDYDVDDSHIKLASGETISIKENMVYEAVRACTPSIPKSYTIIGIGFRGVGVYDLPDSLSYNIRELAVEVVFGKDPSIAQEDELVLFLHEMVSCDNCDYGYFWGCGDFGHRLVSRFVELNRIDLLCEAIKTSVNPVFAFINAVALSLEQNHLDVLKNKKNNLAQTLLDKQHELAEPIKQRLAEIVRKQFV